MGLAAFYGLRGRGERFSTVRLGLLVLSVLALVLTLVGWGKNSCPVTVIASWWY
jgi:hypothetical protein